MLQHGTVNLFQEIRAYVYAVIRTDAENPGIEGGMVNLAKSHAVDH